jgi:CheY-like chemotaxis protein
MKKRGRGTGLGLASVYGTAKQSGGDARITSTVGAGTTIEVFLPYTDQAVQAVEPPRLPATPSRRGHGTILLVEDEAVVASLVQRVLQGCGYRVLVAADGAAGLRMASGSPVRIDFVLTDIVMPVMSGPEMVNHLRRERPGLPVLFMSGYTDDALAEHGFAIDDVELLRKPFTPDALVQRVEQFLAALVPGAGP